MVGIIGGSRTHRGKHARFLGHGRLLACILAKAQVYMLPDHGHKLACFWPRVQACMISDRVHKLACCWIRGANLHACGSAAPTCTRWGLGLKLMFVDGVRLHASAMAFACTLSDHGTQTCMPSNQGRKLAQNLHACKPCVQACTLEGWRVGASFHALGSKAQPRTKGTCWRAESASVHAFCSKAQTCIRSK